MAKKQLSFAEKANRIAGKSDWKYVKYVKSVRSEKTDRWRFNEQIITLQGNESLDDALKRIDESRLALDINLPDFSKTEKVEEPAVAEAVEEVGLDKLDDGPFANVQTPEVVHACWVPNPGT